MYRRNWSVLVCVIFATIIDAVVAQTCYDEGSIVGAVWGTFVVTLLLIGVGYCLYQYYQKKKKGKGRHLIRLGDPENVKDEFAFDNPGFKTTEGHHKSGDVLRSDAWPRMNANGEKSANNDGRTFLDDTFPEMKQGRVMVPLWSKDFTGLGFEVSGSMRDGIYVNRVLRGGPAYESGKIRTGDRINSVRISFRNMVYEDAVNILSYASPYELQLEIQSPLNNSHNAKDFQAKLSALLSGNTNMQRSPGSTLQATGEKSRKIQGYDSLDKNWKSGGVEIRHPVLGIKRHRCNSNGDLSMLEKSTKQHHFSKPPASPNSTLDSSNQSKNTSLKKILAEKIITTSTLEKIKPHQIGKEGKTSNFSTLEKENERNLKNKQNSDISSDIRTKIENENISKPERAKIKPSNDNTNYNNRISAPPDVIIIKDGGDMYSVKNEKLEIQKKEPETGKKGMKFGIRVLPPNIPDDSSINIKSNKHDSMKIGGENGNIVTEIRSIDEVDKGQSGTHEKNDTIEIDSNKPKLAPVVAKRREKPIAPIPNARTIPHNNTTTTMNIDQESGERIKTNFESEINFNRNDDLNSSGIKRDAQGIPQELPSHLLEVAMFAQNNRKAAYDHAIKEKPNRDIPVKSLNMESPEKDLMNAKNAKKSKGKAPSPPEVLLQQKADPNVSSKTNILSADQDSHVSRDMNFTNNFTDEDLHQYDNSGAATMEERNRSDDMILNKFLMNTSTPKVEKGAKKVRPDIPIQNTTNDMDGNSTINETYNDKSSYDGSFRKKDISDSLNNFFDYSKSNEMSDTGSASFNLMENNHKQNNNSSNTIELNSSDIMIHSSSTESQCQSQEDNERKAASLGDLSKLDIINKGNNNKKNLQGSLERAQSLDISTEDGKAITNDKAVSAKKRKSNSTFDDSENENQIDSNDNISQILIHSKEPRLSLDISNLPSIEGLNKFQKNRLKKASEWGNLEDAIIIKKDANNSSNSGSSEAITSNENICELPAIKSKENVNNNDKIDEYNNANNNDLVAVDLIKPDIQTFITRRKADNENNQTESFSLTDTTVEPTVLPSSTLIEPYDNQRKIDDSSKNSVANENKPNIEINTYVSESVQNKYKTNELSVPSGKVSPKLEEKLTMIYDTNIPDDIKVSRHTLVSSLERPKSDLMKKILAQNPVLTSNIESSFPKQHTNSHTDAEKNENEIMKSDLKFVNITNSDLCFDKNNDKINSSFTFLNQPDIMNHKLQLNQINNVQESKMQPPDDFVSNINISGSDSKNDTTDGNFQPEILGGIRNYVSMNENIVTITTDGSQPSSIITIEGDSVTPNIVENFKNSIEITTHNKDSIDAKNFEQSDQSLYNEIISELKKSKSGVTEDIHFSVPNISTSKTYFAEHEKQNKTEINPVILNTESISMPINESVTVNVIDDNYGNKIISQNIEQTVHNFITVRTDKEKYGLSTDRVVENKRIDEIISKSQDTAEMMDDKRYETILVDDLMKKEISIIKNNLENQLNRHSENYMIRNHYNDILDDIENKNDMSTITMTHSSLECDTENNTDESSIKIVKMKKIDETKANEIKKTIQTENTTKIINENILAYHANKANDVDFKSSSNDTFGRDFITEIKIISSEKENPDVKDRNISDKKQEQSDESAPDTHCISMNDFLSNERQFSAREKNDSDKFIKKLSKDESIIQENSNDILKHGDDNQKQKRHSDFDLPRNTHIKFRTATYEPQNPLPNRLSVDKRLSQIEILKSNFEKGSNENVTPFSGYKPLVFTKPSNIPVKLPEKSPQKLPIISPSKIPIFNSQTQKSASQENLDKHTSFQKTSPTNKLSLSSGNISVTSIKSSSRNPSGK